MKYTNYPFPILNKGLKSDIQDSRTINHGAVHYDGRIIPFLIVKSVQSLFLMIIHKVS